MDAVSQAEILESFDHFVDATDTLMKSALNELPATPARRRLIRRMQDMAVRRVRQAAAKRAVSQAIRKLGAEQDVQVLDLLRRFALPTGDDSRDERWARLTSARGVLRACSVLNNEKIPICDRAALLDFDVLLGELARASKGSGVYGPQAF